VLVPDRALDGFAISGNRVRQISPRAIGGARTILYRKPVFAGVACRPPPILVA
jgi:hypothetical protein